METGPKTLIEAVQYFTFEENCIRYLAAKRWPDGVVICPICGRAGAGFLAKQNRWQCSVRHPQRQFSIKVGTIMEDSPISLSKWLPVIWLIGNCRNAISSWEIHRDLGVTQKTAWFMLSRVRLAMQDENHGGGKLAGEVEVDESFIGGKARNMHPDVKARKIHGRGPEGKAIVAAVLERGGKVRAKVVETRKKGKLQKMVRDHVEAGSNVYSDALKSYEGLDEYTHQVIDHAVAYVDGQIHTNGLENFWSLLKRGIKGTYVSVEPFHLFRYLDEQTFRYNNRLNSDGEVVTDAERFSRLCDQIVGKRLMYKHLIGQDRPEAEF